MAFPFRSPIYNRHGTIDCEINVAQPGQPDLWLPFTADPKDGEQHGRDIHAAIVKAGKIAPAPKKGNT